MMGDGHRKLSVDQQGVTIVSDNFQLTTKALTAANGDPSVDSDFALTQVNNIVSELESMTRRAYGQYCGLARAMDLVGERWTLLIIRDLSVHPKTVAELQHGLPRIDAHTLSARLRELEHAKIVRHRPMSDGS